MYAVRSVASTKPLARAGSITKAHLPSPPPSQTPVVDDRLTIAKFAAQHKQDFPVKFSVTKGFYGPSEDLKFSEGDRFRAHSLKQSTVINVQYENGIRENIPATSSIPFAVLFDPNGSSKEAIKGYRFEKISELVQLPVLPPVLWSRKTYQGSSPESSVSANELLIVRRVKSRLVGKQQLKVYSHTQRKEKTLYTSCVGSFSTKPRDVCLFLDDILKHMPDIFPCRAVMLYPENEPPRVIQGVPQRPGPCVVTLMHSSIETYLTISSALKLNGSHSRFLQIPIDLGILVRLDTSEDQPGDAVYEDADIYSPYTHQANQHVHQPTPQDPNQGQFYTNVHFGQERSQNYVMQSPPNSFSSREAAIEQGHYQTPREVRTSSDPIAIGTGNRDEGTNYVLLSKNDEREGKGSFERSPPVSGEASSSSPSYRPPLPPPNRIKRDHRSPGYAYVDANPTRSTCVFNDPRGQRGQAAGSGDNGSVLSTSVPDSASSEKSFGSSGSGGAMVERRGSTSFRPHPPGSGDGLVERVMLRSSSISSAGYSYAKTNPPHPHHLPPSQHPTTSPHHYSHLRSRSGPPNLPQLSPLSAPQQAPPQLMQQQRPVATTCFDSETDSIKVVQRQLSNPAMRPHPLQNQLSRQESAPADARNQRQDLFDGVIDDLAKMSMELGALEENIFTPDDMPSPITGVPPNRASEEPASSSKPAQDLPPEIVEEHKAYLKSLDNYQILRLLENMGLEQYTPTFKQEQINGDILSTCDEDILRDELKVSSRLHRMRLLRVIQGTYSVHEIMSGKDGYIFMASAGKQ